MRICSWVEDLFVGYPVGEALSYNSAQLYAAQQTYPKP